MVRRIQVYRAVWPLLIGLLVVAACNNAMACALCPQKVQPAGHCSDKGADTESQRSGNHGTAVTEQTEQCSHCVTHLPSQPKSLFREVVLNDSPRGIVAADLCVVAVKLSPSINPIEIHDHGPPGRSSPRYVLNNSFRI